MLNITINGKEIAILFGMKAAESYFTRVSVGDKVTADLMVELIWAGVENAAYRERKEPEVSFADVYDWTEAQIMTTEGKDHLNRIYKAFENSQAVKHLAEEGKKIKKKKSTGTN